VKVVRNPFEYDAAPNLDPQRLIDWYIEDYNYSRFMTSRRNVIINGERGSGKSMTLIYHSLTYAAKRAASEASDDTDARTIGIYVPCNTPLSSKEEHRLLPLVPQMRIAEANLTLSIVTNLAREMKEEAALLSAEDRDFLREEFAFAMESEKPEGDACPFDELRKQARRRVRAVQLGLRVEKFDESDAIDTFVMLVIPILEAIRLTKAFAGVHFSLLVDDAQDLNEHQRRLMNSWLGHRDNSIFSIKMAVAGIRTYDFTTAHGGSILEGHDYVTVDLQRPVQNKDSEFGNFARDVVARRLANAGISVSPDDFLPVSRAFASRLSKAKEQAEAEAQKRGYPLGSTAYRDYVYKHGRASYFRNRDPKANKPTYSGFSTMTHLSTGVIRNLLQPCFVMFEHQTSKNKGKPPSEIEPDVQDEVVKAQSDRLWELIENNLEKRLPNCTLEDGQAIARLFTRIAEYFRERLLHHASEPRVVTFIISERDHPAYPKVERLLLLAERAQIVYVRLGTSKKGGGRENYYVPNRMLWPRYGLDAHGQHGRASLRAQDLWAAASENVALTLEGDSSRTGQGMLFDAG
jgi:hypothetical protein